MLEGLFGVYLRLNGVFLLLNLRYCFFFVMWVGNMKMYKMWGFIGCMFNLIGVFYFWCGVMDGFWLD